MNTMVMITMGMLQNLSAFIEHVPFFPRHKTYG